MSGYPSTPTALREKLERLILLPDDAPAWTAFIREELRMPVWLLPAVQIAVRERVWESARDPFIPIRGAVHKLGIAMKLNSGNHAAEDPDDEEE